METLHGEMHRGPIQKAPHSLGKPIEWKLEEATQKAIAGNVIAPHSLGKPIEWKQVHSLRPH